MEQDKVKPSDQEIFSRWEHIRQGAAASWPICLGYVPIGLALGVLAQKAGVPPWAMAFMSVLVFAGSAQFICVAMISSGASLPNIIITTFMINLRHALMSSALAVYFTGVNRWFIALFSYGITDESFAVNMTRFRQKNWSKESALTTNQLPNLAWILATTSGTLIGQCIPQTAFGIDYALTAMFICLLVFQLQNRLYVLIGILAGGCALLWRILIPGDSYIVGAALIAATAGYACKRRKRQ